MQKGIIYEYWRDGVLERTRTITKIEPEVEEEKIGEILLEPSFEEVVYEEKQKDFMLMLLDRLKKENIPLLFSGLAGTGKTYSAKMLACELKKPYVYINGQMTQKRIKDILLNLKENSLVCIDECHNLPVKVAETIYPAIEYGELSVDGKTSKLNNPMFVGTTTEPEGLPKPLLDRFFTVNFNEPNEELIKKILGKMDLPEELINRMINHTINIRNLKKLIKLLDMYGERTVDNLSKIFRIMGINMYSGLSREQDKYIQYLKENKVASLRNLSLILRMSEDRIKYDIEPELIRKELISISSKGRMLNPKIMSETLEELEKAQEQMAKSPKFKQDTRQRAINWLNENKDIKDLFSKRYFELVSFMCEQYENGIEFDLIDWSSFSDDISVKESFENNYLDVL